MAGSIAALESEVQAKVEAQIAKKLQSALEKAAVLAQAHFAGMYNNSRLSATGAYSREVSCSGLSGSVRITPTLSPRPSFIGQPTIAGSHSHMMEVGGQMDWGIWLRSGRTQKVMRPPVLAHDEAQRYLIQAIQEELTDIGMSLG